jgi:hypothetical protein
MAGTRAITVQQLSWKDELTNVVRVAAAIAIGVWIYLAATLTGTSTASRSLLPYQQLVRDRSSIEQRTFRELQEGLLEAETIRSTSAGWPAPEALAEAGIPPFAADPTRKGVRYRWSLIQSGAYINYVGLPDQATAPAWLLLVQEPAPDTPPDQAFEDEEHHRLLDGRMLHVSTWTRPAPAPPAVTPIRVPQSEGWTQLYAVGPGAVMPPPSL